MLDVNSLHLAVYWKENNRSDGKPDPPDSNPTIREQEWNNNKTGKSDRNRGNSWLSVWGCKEQNLFKKIICFFLSASCRSLMSTITTSSLSGSEGDFSCFSLLKLGANLPVIILWCTWDPVPRGHLTKRVPSSFFFFLCVCGQEQSWRTQLVSCLNADFTRPSSSASKASDPVCVCSRGYIQSTCGASPIHTDRGRSGWASERLCGKSLSWPLTPPTTTDRRRHGGGSDSSPPICDKIFSNQLFVCVSSSAYLMSFGWGDSYKTASLSNQTGSQPGSQSSWRGPPHQPSN